MLSDDEFSSLFYFIVPNETLIYSSNWWNFSDFIGVIKSGHTICCPQLKSSYTVCCLRSKYHRLYNIYVVYIQILQVRIEYLLM